MQKILIVDDEEELRELIKALLRRVDAELLEAKSGNQAYEIFLQMQDELDLIISDIRMADGDGISLIKRVKAINPEVPVVAFITGFADISEVEAEDLGAHAMLSKPFAAEDLIRMVNSALKRTGRVKREA